MYIAPPPQYTAPPPPYGFIPQTQTTTTTTIIAPQIYEMQFSAVRLDRKDMLSKSDPFLVLKAATVPGSVGGSILGSSSNININPFKKKKDKRGERILKEDAHGGWVVVYKSEVVQNDHNPTWKPFTVDLTTLAHGSLDQIFLVEVWDHDDRGGHQFMGANKTSMKELMAMRELRLINPDRIGFTSAAGLVKLVHCQAKT